MKFIAITIAASLAVTAGMATPAFAAKEKFQRTKPHVNIGTIGHVDRKEKAPETNAEEQEVQFEIQMGTSDLQNAENVRSQPKAIKQ